MSSGLVPMIRHNLMESREILTRYISKSIYKHSLLRDYNKIEAMFCEIPIVAADVEWTNEIIKNRKTGILVEPDNSKK